LDHFGSRVTEAKKLGASLKAYRRVKATVRSLTEPESRADHGRRRASDHARTPLACSIGRRETWMAKARNPIPEGLYTLTPHLMVKGAAQAIEFYKKAFGAIERSRMPGPNGLIMHASLKIGNSTLFLGDDFPGMEGSSHSPAKVGSTTVVLNLYVEDSDKLFQQAVSAGAKVAMPISDQFWGDRYGQVTDPFGHVWAISTKKEDLTPQEMEERGRQAMAQMGRS
jgi:PhnB protein